MKTNNWPPHYRFKYFKSMYMVYMFVHTIELEMRTTQTTEWNGWTIQQEY